MAGKLEAPAATYPGPAIETESQIRILELLPGNFPHGIECRLLATDVDKQASLNEAYEALSYTWGNWAEHHWITLQGQQYPVTQNLWSALRRLRRIDAPRRLWIDQLCVDQRGIFERNHQVRLMGKVYSRASRVIVWLGDLDDESIECCRRDSMPSDALVALQKQELVFLENPEIKHKRLVLQAALKRTQPKWWERVWVVQEVAKATTDPLFLFGCFEVSFEELQLLQRQSDKSIVEPIKSFRATGQSLVSMRKTIARTVSSDSRDKVYALLDLILPAERNLIEIDYSRSVATIFAEATFASMKASRDSGLFSFVNREPGRRSTLPSWCFDFTSTHYSTSPRPKIHKGTTAKPWTRRKRQVDPALKFNSKDDTIQTSGLLFDKISATFTADIYWINGMAGSPQAYKDRALYPVNWELTSEMPYMMRKHVKGGTSAHQKACRRIQGTRKYFERGVASMPVPDMCDVWFDCMLPQARTGTFQREFCHEWLQYLESVSSAKPTLFITESGFIGMGQADLLEGDVVALPYGADAPIIVREKIGGLWTFHGFAYVNGIMNSELITAAPNLELEEIEFVLT